MKWMVLMPHIDNEEKHDHIIELAFETSQSDVAAGNINGRHTPPDGMEWLQVTPCDVSSGRRPQKDILRLLPLFSKCFCAIHRYEISDCTKT